MISNFDRVRDYEKKIIDQYVQYLEHLMGVMVTLIKEKSKTINFITYRRYLRIKKIDLAYKCDINEFKIN
jgi:hypothetical protein